MARTAYHSVDEYLEAQSEQVRAALLRVRAIVRKALPTAEEVISYNMPAYTLNGARVVCLAGWTKHYSLYGASAQIVGAFAKELAPYTVKKGTISFPMSEPVPAKLIERIVRFRAIELEAKKKPKSLSRSPGT